MAKTGLLINWTPLLPNFKMFFINQSSQVSGRVPLTASTVRRLLQCDKLRELRISDWTVSDDEFLVLEQMVKANNWELFLTRKLISS